MKLIYVAHPFAAQAVNILKMRAICRSIVIAGDAPVAPALYCSRFLRDEEPADRAAGLAIAMHLLTRCDEVWAYPAPATSFVHEEVKRAWQLGIPVVEKGEVALEARDEEVVARNLLVA